MPSEGGIVAIIPARGGSKRLPRKNVLPLAGKPLIAWSIEAARAAPSITAVLVTSDDEEILRVSEQAGAEFCVRRPTELATDTAGTADALVHALEWLDARGEHFNALVLLQPTSPLRTAEDIEGACAMFRDKRAASVISVCPIEHPIEWCNTLDQDLRMDDFLAPEVFGKRSQDFPLRYRLNGAIYVATREAFQAQRSFFVPNSYAYPMPRERSVDIDTEIDFLLAGLLLERR